MANRKLLAVATSIGKLVASEQDYMAIAIRILTRHQWI
jgi:hypothetical protein